MTGPVPQTLIHRNIPLESSGPGMGVPTSRKVREKGGTLWRPKINVKSGGGAPALHERVDKCLQYGL